MQNPATSEVLVAQAKFMTKFDPAFLFASQDSEYKVQINTTTDYKNQKVS